MHLRPQSHSPGTSNATPVIEFSIAASCIENRASPVRRARLQPVGAAVDRVLRAHRASQSPSYASRLQRIAQLWWWCFPPRGAGPRDEAQARHGQGQPPLQAARQKPRFLSAAPGRARPPAPGHSLLLATGRPCAAVAPAPKRRPCAVGQDAFTSILRGRNSRRLGMRTLSTPSLSDASILSVSSSPLNAKVRRYRLERTSA